jgi:hypothetical protein
MTVILSYEINKQPIRILKSCPVSDLLRKQPYLRQLNVQIPSSDCILIQKSETDDKILTEEDLKQSIGHYLSVNNKEIHFQIAILIQIIQYDNNRLILQPISNRNIIIEQLLQSIPNQDDIHQYLASSKSHMILSNNEQLLNLDETKFYLVKDNEICSIIIGRSTDNENEEEMIQQRYTIFATIDDLYKQNEDMMNGQYLLYDDAIIPSRDTSLICFQQIKSPIRFKLNKKNLQASVKITIDDVQLKSISIADVKCLVIHEERSTRIPANKTTLVSTIVEEAFEKLFIPKEHMKMYAVPVLDDQENMEEVDSSVSIEDILTNFSVQSTIISIKLVKK